MTDADFAHARAGPTPDSDADDDVLLRAGDALVADQCITETTWTVLARRLSVTQLVDLVFLTGQYVMVSVFLNSAGVQLEADYR
jgi:4-carboxymuconolactone decarboxylase